MMCQCRFTFVTNEPLWWEMLITGRLCKCGGQRIYRKSLYLPSILLLTKNCSKNKVLEKNIKVSWVVWIVFTLFFHITYTEPTCFLYLGRVLYSFVSLNQLPTFYPWTLKVVNYLRVFFFLYEDFCQFSSSGTSSSFVTIIFLIHVDKFTFTNFLWLDI